MERHPQTSTVTARHGEPPAAGQITRHTRYDDLPELLTPVEFFGYLGIGRTAGYDALRRGDVPTVRLGHRIWIPRTAVTSSTVNNTGKRIG